MSKWWESDMSSAGQALYADPAMAVQVATLNDNMLKSQKKQQEAQTKATADKGGFMGWLSHTISSADGALSNVPGWGEAKNVGKAAWWPVDKIATGARWLYSEGVSQPLATAFLVSGQAEHEGYGKFFSGDTWKQEYGKAENISPAQAYMNASAEEAATDEGVKIPSLMGTKFSKAEKDQISRQYDRFATDTDYWRNKVGWKYTAGTGALDFFFNVTGDPLAPVIGATAGAVKGARSIQLVDDGSGLVRSKGVVRDIIGKAPETIEEVSQGKKMNKFFDWADGKSASEIAAHPIWGSGRRVNPFANQYGQVLSKAYRDEMPLMLRFAAGDNAAAGELSAMGTQTLADLGKMSDNRTLVNSVKLDPDTAGYFAAREAGAAPEALAPLAKGRLLEAPFPRPTTPGPRQSGWDATYGRVEAQAKLSRQAVREVGIKPAAGIAPASDSELKMADQWLSAKRDLVESEFTGMQAQADYLGSVLGSNLGRSVEDFSPGEANLFGTMKQMYRMGPAALRSAEATAESKFARTTGAARDSRDGGLVTRTLRRGFYDTPKRVVQSFGDKLPEGRIDHNDIDASDRVAEMLRRVPGLNSEQRASMLDDYTTAGDKTARSSALSTIQTNVILHMANRVHGLDPEVSKVIAQISKDGIDSTMAKLTNRAPTSQAFSSAVSPQTGRTVDKIDDDGAWILSPLAKTQLSATDTLLPVDEINSMLARHSGALQGIRQAGGSAADAVSSFGDMFNNLWKASTLLRPGYVPRMISDEVLLSAIKFGGMSRLVGDSAKGGQNFVRNRAQQVRAIAGKGSYTPTTGAGLESSHAIVKIVDPDVAAAAAARGEKVEKIRVNKALPLARNMIDEERGLLDDVNSDIAKYTTKHQAAVAKGDSLKAGVLRDKLDLLEAKAQDHKNVISEHADYANEILRVAKASAGQRLGSGEFEAFGQKVPQAFSGEWENSIPRDQITSDPAFAALVGRREAIHAGRAIKTGSWDYITPDKPEHMSSWLDSLNKQFRQDPVFRLVAGSDNNAPALSWLRTPDGAAHLRDLGVRARDPKGLVADIRHTLDKYLPAGTGLRAKMADNEDITEADLRSAISADDFPSVHGEEVKYLTGIFHKETAGYYVDSAIQKGFKWLATAPSDILSRQPTYVHLQESRMKDLMAQEISYRKGAGKGEHLDADVLERIRNKSDKMARKDLSKIMYDPQRTSASQALRWVYPFLSAHTDGLARWGGMLAEDPKQITKLAKVYNAPVAANLVTDGQGNPVDMEGNVTVTDPATGKKVKQFVGLESRVLHLRMPWTGYKKGGSSAGTPISLSAINTILPGDPWFNPGSGPLVQIAGSQVARSNPSVGDFLQWSKVLPYGPTGVIESMTPKYIRAAYDAWNADDPNNVKYQQAYLSVYNKKVAEFHEGKIDSVSPQQVEKEAKSFMWLQALTAWASPAQTQATPLTGTPYQFYVDQYKQMQQADPSGAQDAFLSKYGEDYFQFTTSMSQSMGIASTISAESQAQKYKDLIATDPDMAPFIVGDIYNGGPFSSSVYQKQMDEMIGGRQVRSKMSAQDAINQNQVDLGWSKYRAMKTGLDSALIRAGFTSYSQSGAEGINEAKQKIVAYLTETNPQWGKAFSTTDRGIVPRRIQSFETLVNDKKLNSDPMRQEIPVLKDYLAARKSMKGVLQSRGLSQISRDSTGHPIGQAADVGQAWDQMTMSFLNNNLSFSQLYNRYLSNDDLQ